LTGAETAILGAGVTGLAAGVASGLRVYEAVESPGGICASYYRRTGENRRLRSDPGDGTAYRFEIGGGHWIFGGDPLVLRFIERRIPVHRYRRMSAVFFSNEGRYVPYPLQNHLAHLEPSLARQALFEITGKNLSSSASTMAEWLEGIFGPTLVRTFFGPFHERYTAGLWTRIAPQDSYKSPVNLTHVSQGMDSDAPDVGYNVTFLYPEGGLDRMASAVAERCEVRYGKRVIAVDAHKREVEFSDGSGLGYESLVSTLPLNRMLQLADLKSPEREDPFTSVLVLNIGGVRGNQCPPFHWIYVPDSETGFHRVGFYSNVADSFVPATDDGASGNVGIYVERAYVGGTRPTPDEVAAVADATVQELKAWGFLEEAHIVDPTWIDVAYTWSWPDSRWRKDAMSILESHGIFPVGRYGRWNFQGIADSLRDGFIAGASLTPDVRPSPGR
jgi:protoporphyrinogen oxidase